MPIEMVDVEELKKKFGWLISYLSQDVGLSNQGIDSLIFSHPFFDFLEEGNANLLLDSTMEEIGKLLFPQAKAVPALAEEDPTLAWTGRTALSVALHYSLPLKSVFLRCPLSDFLSLYHPYHEMADDRLYSKWDDIVSSTRLLSLLLKRTNQNERKLALLSGVGLETLRKAAISDSAYYAMKSQSVLSIASFLKASISLFRERSSFDYLESFYFSSSDFLPLLAKSYLSLLPPRYRFLADEIFLKGEKPASCLFLVDDFLSKEEKKELLKSSSFVLLHGFPSYLFENFGEKKRLISDD
jgi:hypothetical protein